MDYVARCAAAAKRGEWGWVQYRCFRCDRQTSATAGTIQEDARRPLLMCLRAIWCMTNQKQGCSASGLQGALGLVSYQTAWVWLHELRTAMVRPGRDRLLGVVEIDETYIAGEQPGKRGHGAAGKSLMVISVERGSVVGTDDWGGYVCLEANGYCGRVARKTADVRENPLRLANRGTALSKGWLFGAHHGAVRASRLDYYLDEYKFRFDDRISRFREKVFYRLAQQAAAGSARDEAGHARRASAPVEHNL